jgi:hypothetical protein
MQSYPVLTVHAQYAYAIAHGPKRVENRPRRIRYRGPLWIHASAAPLPADALDWLRSIGCAPPEELPRAAVVALVDVIGCEPLSTLWAETDPLAWGPWLWQLGNVRALPRPIPAKGAQGLWRLPDSIERSALDQINPVST